MGNITLPQHQAPQNPHDTSPNEVDDMDSKPSIKKALLIGINYVGTRSELRGCINDTKNIKTFLVNNKYFSDNEIVMMNDYLTGDCYPTFNNITKQFSQIIKFAELYPDKRVELMVTYSGHGSSIKDVNNDEADGQDEVLCPVDYEQSGFITDDYIFANFISKLPKNARMVFLSDSCNSGTVLDLKYNYNTTNNIVSNNPETNCKIVMVSGCRDDQTSADAYLKDQDGKYIHQGAMTASFLACYYDGISYDRLLDDMKNWLNMMKMTQVPQLSSGKVLDLSKAFLLNKFKI